MYIRKIREQSVFIKEKDLKFSTAAWMKLLEKKIMEWRDSRSKNTVFQTVIETQNPVKDGGLLYPNRKKKEWKALHSPLLTLLKLLALQQTGRLGRIDQIGHAAQADAQRRQVVHHRRGCGSQHAGNAQTDQ